MVVDVSQVLNVQSVVQKIIENYQFIKRVVAQLINVINVVTSGLYNTNTDILESNKKIYPAQIAVHKDGFLLWRICDKRFDNLTITSEDFDHERRIV